jgi:hypothetical protein
LISVEKVEKNKSGINYAKLQLPVLAILVSINRLFRTVQTDYWYRYYPYSFSGILSEDSFYICKKNNT